MSEECSPSKTSLCTRWGTTTTVQKICHAGPTTRTKACKVKLACGDPYAMLKHPDGRCSHPAGIRPRCQSTPPVLASHNVDILRRGGTLTKTRRRLQACIQEPCGPNHVW